MALPQSAAVGLGVLLMCAGAAAQSTTAEHHEKTKIEVKDGKRVTLTGCVARAADGYVLLDRDGGFKYALVTDDNLSKFVDRRVEVKGTAADRGDGKVKIEHKVEGTSGETQQKIEAKGDAIDLPYLGVKSIKAVAGSCR
jgi:hypothetical protein